MKNFIVVIGLLSFIAIHSSDREDYQELASDSEDSLQEEGRLSQKKQPQEKFFPEELKQDEDSSDDENPGGGKMEAPIFRRSYRQWKKDKVEKEALKLPPEERLKLGIKLCTTKLEEVNTEKLTHHTITSIQTCSLLLGTMAAHAAVAHPVSVRSYHAEHRRANLQQEYNQQERGLSCCVVL